MKSLTKDSTNVKIWKDAVKCSLIASIVLITLVAVETLLPIQKYDNFFGMSNLVGLKEEQIVDKNGPIPGCDLFSGKWVYDNVSYPLYKEEQCSFLGNSELACVKNGRKDFKYQNWRWQPHHCDIPRFNTSALLETLRGKTIIFVGDSLGGNQWQSLICLITTSLPPSSLKSWELQNRYDGRFYNYSSSEYNLTIAYQWAPFLVESDSDGGHHAPHNTTLRIKSIEKHGKRWIDADILVFDSFCWWMAGHWFTILWGSFDGPDSIYKIAEINPRLYEIALNTWSDWLEMQINPKKIRMFFTSHSPFHFGPNVPSIFHCISKEEPISDEKHWPSSVNRDLMQVVESTIEKLQQRGVKVEYLNITQLSGSRVDAHPGLNNNKQTSDCLHWCLPGVPDIWNQILYAYIMKS